MGKNFLKLNLNYFCFLNEIKKNHKAFDTKFLEWVYVKITCKILRNGYTHFLIDLKLIATYGADWDELVGVIHHGNQQIEQDDYIDHREGPKH